MLFRSHYAIVLDPLGPLFRQAGNHESDSPNNRRKETCHNRDEEIEHACMTLEWIRRHNKRFDKELREYLFTEGPIKDKED